MHYPYCKDKFHLVICIPQPLENLSTVGTEKFYCLNQEVPHSLSLLRSYLPLNVNNILVFFDFLHAFSIIEHSNKRTITEVRFEKRINQQDTFI